MTSDNGQLVVKDGWKIAKMSELFDIKSSKRVHKSDWQTEGVPFYRAREVVKLAKYGEVDNDLYITQDLYEEFTKIKGAPKEGDIIISAVGTLGQCYLVTKDDKFYFKDASVLWFEKYSEINTNYIIYAFKSDLIISQVMNKSMGATVGTLTITRAKNIEIPIPPLAEQKQIVALLDQAFTAIDKAQANIETNINNAKELFQSKLNDIFSQTGEGWEERTFIDVCVLQRGFDLPKRLRKEGEFDLVTSSGIKDTHFEYKVEGPGVVTGRSGSIGKVFYVESKFWPLNTALYIKDFKGNNEKYIYYFLKNFDLSKYSTGTGVPTLNRNFVHDKPVLSTNRIDEQLNIVDQLDKLTLFISQINNSYKNKIIELEELKKSILQKAFNGELT